MRKFEICHDIKGNYPDITLPTRADNGSAGYDFYAPYDFSIPPQTSKIIPTYVKASMETNEVLLLYVRSSIGIRKGITLTNGTGVIDSTYYNNPDNEGNICIALKNNTDFPVSFKKNERIMQGVFTKYLTVDDDKPLSNARKGGIGSSGK